MTFAVIPPSTTISSDEMPRMELPAAVVVSLRPAARAAAGTAPITNPDVAHPLCYRADITDRMVKERSGGAVFAEGFLRSLDVEMRVIATRDDVHPSDDPGPLDLEIADGTSPEEVLRRAADLSWLPSIQGNRATWSIASNEPLAVLAYEWPDLKFLPRLAERMEAAERRDGALLLFFNYHAQHDPEMVYRILWGLQLHS